MYLILIRRLQVFFQKSCFVVTVSIYKISILTSASRGPSAVAELLVIQYRCVTHTHTHTHTHRTDHSIWATKVVGRNPGWATGSRGRRHHGWWRMHDQYRRLKVDADRRLHSDCAARFRFSSTCKLLSSIFHVFTASWLYISVLRSLCFMLRSPDDFNVTYFILLLWPEQTHLSKYSMPETLGRYYVIRHTTSDFCICGFSLSLRYVVAAAVGICEK